MNDVGYDRDADVLAEWLWIESDKIAHKYGLSREAVINDILLGDIRWVAYAREIQSLVRDMKKESLSLAKDYGYEHRAVVKDVMMRLHFIMSTPSWR